MSAFGAKRKARIIQTLDDEDGPSLIGIEEPKDDKDLSFGLIKFGRNKASKSSSLRKSINVNELDDHSGDGEPTRRSAAAAGEGDEGSGAPVVIRPALSRSGSTKQKKRASSRLSFGPGEDIGDDEGASGVFTPKKTLGQRALENNALRRSASLQNLADRFIGGEEERPRYSKEYLEELQSSTPNTPQNVSSLWTTDDDQMELDPSELDGALVVQSQDVAPTQSHGQPSAANVLSEAEIRERKERRARLAQEADFIALDDGDPEYSDDGDGGNRSGGRMTLQFKTKNKKSESRLVPDDEDLGEGYDEFVADGGLALGRKAEREAARRHRQEMADLIKAAEDGSEADSDDSEAERRAAYEAAQRRAGMDGLQRHHHDMDMDGDGEGGVNVIPRMKPLPELSEVLQRMRDLVQGLEDEAARKRTRIADLEREKEEILSREKEVQEILNQAGAKYQAVVGNGAAAGDMAKLAAQSPLRHIPPGISGHLPVERGLESFGTTPTRNIDLEDMA